MEYALGDSLYRRSVGYMPVLILVVMEYALGEHSKTSGRNRTLAVLILVVMEYALGGHEAL